MALLSGLYCDDETLDNNDLNLDNSHYPTPDSPKISNLDLAWDEAGLDSLLLKEAEQGCVEVDLEFVETRKEVVEWMSRFCSVFKFSEVSVALSVSYFDRFLSSGGVRKEKPWMGQLAVVACLSLAVKMEEVEVPLLADLQTNIEPKFVLFFDCPEEERDKRNLGQNQGREDDSIETIRKRFEIFLESSLPVIHYYESKGKVRKIDAGKPVDEVFKSVKTVI